MDKAYNHKEHEDKIYDTWKKSGAFKPNNSKKSFSIALPPPNANAPLHYGHAMYTVEDILIRYHRMLGESVLWLPGADHAGFETQVVYEKHLDKEGKSRFDFDRDTLYKNIWDFVQGNRGTMENQLKKLGFSLDWSRLKFTLDDQIVKTVYKTFKKMYDEGYVYRDTRLVNYCTKHGTAFSDLEVDHVEKNSPLYYIKYFFVDNKEKYITVATTRPEPIYVDTHLAINPKNKKTKHLKGQKLLNPLTGAVMEIIEDSFVDPEFGTGIVKLTPAHDQTDFEVAKKLNLPIIEAINTQGKMIGGPCIGKKVLIAREETIKILTESDHVEKVDTEYKNNVGTCYKCGNTLEPLPIPQWYVKVDKLAKPAIDAVKNGEIKIIPKRFEKIYYHWMNNIHDWNISRQVVWGIRIPAWKNINTGEWVVTEGDAPKGNEWVQDTDTFDTWFSSGQWPFATLGFPNGDDFKKFYPIDVLETGYDILFFWVARMIMLGIYVTGEVPFKNVYLHGIVRDSKGVKMSKSKGNVINPLEILEKYGADALRMSLISGAGAGSDQNYSESKVVGYRNFSNKIWNAVRFVKEFESEASDAKSVGNYDKFMAETISLSTKYIDNFKLNNAAETLYKRFWNNFCDIRIEDSKKGKLNRDDLMRGLLVYLKLLHPFMPFVTEAVWRELGNDTLLIVSKWPNMSNV